MRQMDILLCPYQKQVYLKDQKTSTSSIMSPLKLFEYMSTKKVIISSNLNVLREVLINNVNCFLANPRNTQEWVNLIIRISKNKNLYNTISTKAYLTFKSKYSWDIRVKKLFKFLDEKKIKITVVGLGYVGLPLALEFGKKYSTIGFDIDKSRIEELNKKR